MSDGRLISDGYIDQLRHLHENEDWGTTGPTHAKWALNLFMGHGCRTALDYGAGKGELSKHMPDMKNYDPVTFPGKPKPADLVTCTDVLEHVEPEFVDSVIEHIASLTRRVAFFVIATVPARAFLPDGRNAHLIVEGQEWWLPRIMEHFQIEQMTQRKNGMLITATPR